MKRSQKSPTGTSQGIETSAKIAGDRAMKRLLEKYKGKNSYKKNSPPVI